MPSIQAAHAQHGQHRADHIDVPRTGVRDVMDEFDGLFASVPRRSFVLYVLDFDHDGTAKGVVGVDI